MTSSPPTAAGNDPEIAPIADGEAPTELGWWDQRTVVVQATFALVAVLVLFLLVFYGFALMYVHPFRWWPWSGTGEHATASQYDLTRNSATVAALLGGAVAIAVTLRRQRSTERTVELTEETSRIAQETARIAQDSVKIAQETASITAQAYQLDQARAAREEIDRLRDRYTTITHQLGHLAAPVRLAGVYAMAALADDWLKRDSDTGEAQVCIDVLCAYFRTPGPDTSSEADRLSETRVRETITTVIGHHLQADAGCSWSDCAFDFTGATFTGYHSFRGAHFNKGNRLIFTGANFNKGSDVRFSDANFNGGGRVSFSGANFNEGSNVHFRTANFNRGSDVSFDGANFNEGGRLHFSGANFNKGSHVGFRWAKFNRDSHVRFVVAKFNEGSRVNFSSANFNGGGRVSFSGANFNEGSYVGFRFAKFNEGSEVAFRTAKFNEGSRVDFGDAKFNDGWPVGPWGDERPDRWPRG